VTRKAIIGMIRAAALGAALFLAGGAIPILGGVAMLFAPAPVLIYAVGREHANLRSSIAVLLAAVLVSVAAGWFAGASYLATFGIATLIISLLLERRYRFEVIVVAVVAVFLVVATLGALIATGSPAALVKAMQTELTTGMARGSQLYKMVGMPNAVPADTQAEIIDLTIKLSPALVAMLAALAALMNLRIFWRWVGRQRLPYTLFGDLLRWSAPERLIWALIGTGFGIMAPVQALSALALNGFLCVAAVYFCQGLAIMAFYFQMLAVPSIVRGVIYFIALVQPVVAAIVCVAGVFDMWIDFRRLKPPRQEAGNFSDFI